jgi:hypothetical protein
MLIFSILARFHMPSSSGSLVITNRKINYIIGLPPCFILYFYEGILPHILNRGLRQAYHSFKESYHLSNDRETENQRSGPKRDVEPVKKEKVLPRISVGP